MASINWHANLILYILNMDLEQDPIASILKAVAGILNRLAIPYFITGGIAALKWGRVRSTVDIDLVVRLVPQKIDQLAESLLKIDKYAYVDKQAIKVAFEAKGEFNFIHGSSGVKVDFWVEKDNDLSRTQMERRVKEEIEGEAVYFCTPEDLILNKLAWHKDSGSALQLEDVRSVLERQKNLDFEYLDKWSIVQGTKNVLEELKQKP